MLRTFKPKTFHIHAFLYILRSLDAVCLNCCLFVYARSLQRSKRSSSSPFVLRILTARKLGREQKRRERGMGVGGGGNACEQKTWKTVRIQTGLLIGAARHNFYRVMYGTGASGCPLPYLYLSKLASLSQILMKRRIFTKFDMINRSMEVVFVCMKNTTNFCFAWHTQSGPFPHYLCAYRSSNCKHVNSVEHLRIDTVCQLYIVTIQLWLQVVAVFKLIVQYC